MKSTVKLTIIWKNIGAGYESDPLFKLGWSFSNGSLFGIKKKNVPKWFLKVDLFQITF